MQSTNFNTSTSNILYTNNDGINTHHTYTQNTSPSNSELTTEQYDFCSVNNVNLNDVILHNHITVKMLFDLANHMGMKINKLNQHLNSSSTLSKLKVMELDKIISYLKTTEPYKKPFGYGGQFSIEKDKMKKSDAAILILTLLKYPEKAEEYFDQHVHSNLYIQAKLDLSVTMLESTFKKIPKILFDQYRLDQPIASKEWNTTEKSFPNKSIRIKFNVSNNMIKNKNSIMLITGNSKKLLTYGDYQLNPITINGKSLKNPGALRTYLDISSYVETGTNTILFTIKSSQHKNDYKYGYFIILSLSSSKDLVINYNKNEKPQDEKLTSIFMNSLNELTGKGLLTYPGYSRFLSSISMVPLKTAKAKWHEFVKGQYQNQLKSETMKQKRLLETKDDLLVDEDIITFICPLTLKRINFPVKFDICKHRQCFDCVSFVQMTSASKSDQKFPCPCCKNKLDLFHLRLDPYLSNLLLKYPNADSCIINPDLTDKPHQNSDTSLPNSSNITNGHQSNPVERNKTANSTIIIDLDDELNDISPVNKVPKLNQHDNVKSNLTNGIIKNTVNKSKEINIDSSGDNEDVIIISDSESELDDRSSNKSSSSNDTLSSKIPLRRLISMGNSFEVNSNNNSKKGMKNTSLSSSTSTSSSSLPSISNNINVLNIKSSAKRVIDDDDDDDDDISTNISDKDKTAHNASYDNEFLVL